MEAKRDPAFQADHVQLAAQGFNWIESLAALPNTLLGKAVHYARSQQKYLVKYLLDGRLEISNNRAERSIKPFVIGRNYVLKRITVKTGSFPAHQTAPKPVQFTTA